MNFLWYCEHSRILVWLIKWSFRLGVWTSLFSNWLESYHITNLHRYPSVRDMMGCKCRYNCRHCAKKEDACERFLEDGTKP